MSLEPRIGAACRFRVYLYGPLDILQGTSGIPLERERWGAGKAARSVFKRLLAAPGRRLSRARLLEDIWPQTDFELADKHLYNAMSVIHRVIGKDLVKTWEATYELVGQPLIWVDSDACEQLLKTVENSRSRPVHLLETALAYLERGDYLEREGGAWCYALRKKAGDMFRQCRLWLAEAYEEQGKLWQAGEQYRAVLTVFPSDEATLYSWMTLLERHGRVQEALHCFQQAKHIRLQVEGDTPSLELEVLAERLRDQPLSTYKQPPNLFPIRYTKNISTSQENALIEEQEAIRMADNHLVEEPHGKSEGYTIAASADYTRVPSVLTGLTGLFTDELLAVYEKGIGACQDLYFQGYPQQVEALLPLYCAQTGVLAQQPSLLQPSAARLASQAQQLTCELLTDREDFGSAERAGQQAFLYGQLAQDRNLQITSLIGLANLGFHRRLSLAALEAYEQAIMLFDEYVTPLVRGRTYAGIAEVYAMRGQFQEAMRALGLAYECYPGDPQADPAYPYVRASRYALYVFGDAQSRLFLGQPREAEQALITMQKETDDPQIEPVTRLDWLYYQAEIHIQYADLEASTTILAEAAALAKHLGSRLYFNKLAGNYYHLLHKWPQEKLVSALDETFRPW